MPTAAKHLDISVLNPASRRELLDFYQFLLDRNTRLQKKRTMKQRFTDLCGKLSWKGDPVMAQRRIRDEW